MTSPFFLRIMNRVGRSRLATSQSFGHSDQKSGHCYVVHIQSLRTDDVLFPKTATDDYDGLHDVHNSVTDDHAHDVIIHPPFQMVVTHDSLGAVDYLQELCTLHHTYDKNLPILVVTSHAVASRLPLFQTHAPDHHVLYVLTFASPICYLVLIVNDVSISHHFLLVNYVKPYLVAIGMKKIGAISSSSSGFSAEMLGYPLTL